MTTVKTARSYSVNNVQTAGLSADRYGAQIDYASDVITLTLFADTGATPLVLDTGANDPTDDAIVVGYPKTITGYTLEHANVDDSTYGFPLTFFYETISTDVTITDHLGNIIEVYDDRFITLKFTDNKDLERHLLIMQVSGLVEEYANNPT